MNQGPQTVKMWRILLNMRLRLEIVTAEYITEILFRNSVLLVHRFDNILYTFVS